MDTSQLPHFLSLHRLRSGRKSLLALLSLLLLLLVAYNGATIFCINLLFLAKSPPRPTSFSSEKSVGEGQKWPISSAKLASTMMLSVKEENPSSILKTLAPISPKSKDLAPLVENSLAYLLKQSRRRKPLFETLRLKARQKQFSTRVKEFFSDSSLNSSCEPRFFMTWISSLDSFSERELFTVESLFKSHPTSCLIIVSNSIDSSRGMQILSPFLGKGFRVTAISPDFDYLFKNTVAETWFNELRKGNVDPGKVSLGQNLSNVLRLALLYKFGGIYIDSDVIVLKSFAELRNCMGAQTVDLETGNWSRLNNAVMVFDKGHPLLYKFIEEFALTFDGNKWGHNGPYLVSRVVSRVSGRPGFDFSILDPMAFYPVYWSRVHGLFHGPRNETHQKWLNAKLQQIRSKSYMVHLWNRQSRELKIEEGSIISRIMQDCCIFCNSSVPVSIQ